MKTLHVPTKNVLRSLVPLLVVFSCIFLTPISAHADSIGTSPSGVSVPGGSLCGAGSTGCTVVCSGGGAYDANWTYADPFPWCNWSRTTYSLDSKRSFCPTGFYSWSFYGTVASPSYAWTVSRTPIYNNCPTVPDTVWVLSPTPADYGHPNVETSPQTWASGSLAGQQRHEFLDSIGLPLWNITGNASYYAPYGTIKSGGGSCQDIQTSTTATYINQILAGYNAGNATYTSDADNIFAIYQHYRSTFTASPTVANVKVGLPESYPSINLSGSNPERALLVALSADYNKQNTGHGAVWDCGSVLQYSVLNTTPTAAHAALGSCVLPTERQEFGIIAGSGQVSGAMPRLKGTSPVGGNRWYINGAYAPTNQNIRSSVTPADPVVPNSVFTSWRSTINSELAGMTFNAAAPLDGTFVGPAYTGTAYNDSSSPNNPALAASQAAAHAVCTMDAPLVITLPPPTTTPTTPPTTTTVTGGQQGTTTTVTVGQKGTTTTTTTTPPAGGPPLQTITDQIPVFADGGSLRPQQFEANIQAFTPASPPCNTILGGVVCYPLTLSITATVTGTGGYTKCSSPTQSNCDFYVMPSAPPPATNCAPASSTNPYDTCRVWGIEFFAPTTKTQHVVITFTASGTYEDYRMEQHTIVSTSTTTAAACAGLGGSYSKGTCTTTQVVTLPTAYAAGSYSVYVPNPTSRIVSGSVPTG